MFLMKSTYQSTIMQPDYEVYVNNLKFSQKISEISRGSIVEMSEQVSYIVRLLRLWEDRSEEEMLKVGLSIPTLEAETIANEEVLAAVEKALQSRSPAARSFVLRVLAHSEKVKFPAKLWLLGLELLGDEHVEVAEHALEFGVAFATMERMTFEGTRVVLDEVFKGSSAQALRVLELLVKIAVFQEDIFGSPIVGWGVSKTIQLATRGDLPVMLASLDLARLLLSSPWCQQTVLKSALVSGVMTRIDQSQSSMEKAAVLRLCGSVAASCGQVGFDWIIKEGLLTDARKRIICAAHESESDMDALFYLLIGVSRGSVDGMLLLSQEHGILEDVLCIIKSDECRCARTGACSMIAEVIEGMSQEAVFEVVTDRDSGKGLVVNLLHLLMEQLPVHQRVGVLRLLTALIRRFPDWAFRSDPLLLSFIVNESTTEAANKETYQWRYDMANHILKMERSRLLCILGSMSAIEQLESYVQRGMYGSYEIKEQRD